MRWAAKQKVADRCPDEMKCAIFRHERHIHLPHDNRKRIAADMKEIVGRVEKAIHYAVNEIKRSDEFHEDRKLGKSLIQPHVGNILRDSGFEVDFEDGACFFPPQIPAWRDKKTEKIVETRGRRKIDLVVRSSDTVIALVEIESDLNDLRESGVSSRSRHYDVFSIARDAEGRYFDSYKSLERMATAAFIATGRSLEELEALASNVPADHNPLGFGIFLVTGSSRSMDRRILAPRLESLDARLISVVELP